MLPPVHGGDGREQPAPSDDLAGQITQLPERQKLVIAMLYYEGLTLDDVASLLDTTAEAVAQLELAALKALGPSAVTLKKMLRVSDELIWTGKHDDGGGKITRPQKEMLQKLADLLEVSSEIDTELEPPIGQVKIYADGTAAPLSDDPDEFAKIRRWLALAGVST